MPMQECLCAICRQPLPEDPDALVQRPILKAGALAYIELAHRSCAPAWAVHDDLAPFTARICQLEDALQAFCREANWGASALSADTIDQVNRAGRRTVRG